MSCVIILQALCLSEVTTGDFFYAWYCSYSSAEIQFKKHCVNEIIHTFRLKPTVLYLYCTLVQYSVHCTVSAPSPRAGFHICNINKVKICIL